MADKIKRGVEVTRKDNGENWFCERDRQDGTILLRDTPNESPQAIYFDTVLSNITTARKAVTGLKNTQKPKTEKQKTEEQLLNEFFDKVGLKIPFNCENCKKPLYAFNKKAKRSASAHILPKAHFPSVATNENNILYMGALYIGQCGCHDNWDNSVSKRIKMPIYKKALQQFEKLIPALSQKELIMAYSYLDIKWQ